MSKIQNKMNDSSSEFIQENILKENPEGLPESNLIIAKAIPPSPKMRRVTFLNGRDPGVPLEFHYHSATHPLKHYKLYHGKDVELPEEVIAHLENCSESVYGYRKDQEGKPEMFVKTLKYIFTCKTPRAA